MSSSRVKFRRTVGSLNADAFDYSELLRRLRSEDIEAVLDVRPTSVGEHLAKLCESFEMYYRSEPALTEAASREEEHGQPDRQVAWATGVALRHYVCILTSGDDAQTAVAEAMARVGGIRHLNFDESPTAPAALNRTLR